MSNLRASQYFANSVNEHFDRTGIDYTVRSKEDIHIVLSEITSKITERISYIDRNWIGIVESFISTFPSKPIKGAKYIVRGASAQLIGLENQIIISNNSNQIDNYVPPEGALAFIKSESSLYFYKDGVWSIFEGVNTVLDSINTPPVSPAIGDSYLVTGVATGDWTGHEDDIATWTGTEWVFKQPQLGDIIADIANNDILIYNGVSWNNTKLVLTNGQGTTANGSAVDLGGTITNPRLINIDTGGTFEIDYIGTGRWKTEFFMEQISSRGATVLRTFDNNNPTRFAGFKLSDTLVESGASEPSYIVTAGNGLFAGMHTYNSVTGRTVKFNVWNAGYINIEGVDFMAYNADYSATYNSGGVLDRVIPDIGWINNHINGKATDTIDALNTNTGPGPTEDGYALVWNETAGEYILADTTFILTNGNGTTANGSAVNLGGTLTGNVLISGSGWNIVESGDNFYNETNDGFSGHVFLSFFNSDGTYSQIDLKGGTPEWTNITYVTAVAYEGSIQYLLNGDSGRVIYQFSGNNAGTEIQQERNTIIVTGTGISSAFDGIKYGADYSAAFVDRSLVDKAYVDGLVSSLLIGTDNQIPFVNTTNDGFEYSNSLLYNGTALTVSSEINLGTNLETADRIIRAQASGASASIYMIPKSTGSVAIYGGTSGDARLRFHSGTPMASSGKAEIRWDTTSNSLLLETQATTNRNIRLEPDGTGILVYQAENSGTSTIQYFEISRTTTGTPSANFGAGINFSLENSLGTQRSNTLAVDWTNATNGAENTAFTFSGYNAGALTDFLTIQGGQSIIVNTGAGSSIQLGANTSGGSARSVTAAGSGTDIALNIVPKGAGNVSLGTMTFDADQTIGAGQDNYVLTYDQGTGLISLEAAGGGGAFTAAVSTEITPTTAIVLTDIASDEIALDLSFTVNKSSGTNNYTGLFMNVTEAAAPGANDRLVDLQVGGASKFTVDNSGNININPTDAGTSSNLYFGTDDYIRRSGTNVLQFVFSGGVELEITDSGFRAGGTVGYPYLKSAATFQYVFVGDEDTGYNRIGADDLGIYSGNVVGIRATKATTSVNIGFNGNSFGTGDGVIFIGDATTNPSTNPTGGGLLYVDGDGIYYRDTSGRIVQLNEHLASFNTSVIQALNTNTGPGSNENGYVVVWNNSSGEFVISTILNEVQPAWIAVSTSPGYSGNWSDVTGEMKLQYRKDDHNVVWVRGKAEDASSLSTDSVIFVLPVGYRPPEDIKIPFGGWRVAAGAVIASSAVVQIDTLGNVSFSFAGTEYTTGDDLTFNFCFSVDSNSLGVGA